MSRSLPVLDNRIALVPRIPWKIWCQHLTWLLLLMFLGDADGSGDGAGGGFDDLTTMMMMTMMMMRRMRRRRMIIHQPRCLCKPFEHMLLMLLERIWTWRTCYCSLLGAFVRISPVWEMAPDWWENMPFGERVPCVYLQ